MGPRVPNPLSSSGESSCELRRPRRRRASGQRSRVPRDCLACCIAGAMRRQGRSRRRGEAAPHRTLLFGITLDQFGGTSQLAVWMLSFGTCGLACLARFCRTISCPETIRNGDRKGSLGDLGARKSGLGRRTAGPPQTTLRYSPISTPNSTAWWSAFQRRTWGRRLGNGPARAILCLTVRSNEITRT
jgi:hypothetical protein